MNRRRFVTSSAALAGAAAFTPIGADPSRALGMTQQQQPEPPLPEAVRNLRPMTPAPVSITDDERRARIEKARRLLRDNGMAAMFLEPGSSMFYYTGVQWGLSERTFGVVIPVNGDLAYVSPGFEEERARELTKFSTDVRVWPGHEAPLQRS